MRFDSLWLTADTKKRGALVTVRLATCRNCGRTKILSRPCGFDHLAAILEFRSVTDLDVPVDAAPDTAPKDRES